MWYNERSTGGYSNPQFYLCCGLNNFPVGHLMHTPPYIRALLESRGAMNDEFRAMIRGYNSALSFTSLGANLDETVQNRIGGAYCFRIHGLLYHRIGSLLPEPGSAAKFAQIYIYDRRRDVELNTRYSYNTRLNRDILAMLQDIMHSLPNPYVSLFLTMKDFIDANPNVVPELQFVLKAEGAPDPRVYNVPTSQSEIAVIMPGSGNGEDARSCTSRDIILRPLNGGQLQAISQNNRAYDGLSYPLMFPYGEEGWHMNMRTREDKKLTLMNFYFFRLMFRSPNNSFHLYGNLLQQYIVDMYAKIEQERLFYVMQNQNKFRAHIFRGLEDALNHNERDLRTIGRRVVLTSSFIGGPRHMAQLYQDAISIVRRLGRPDLFITVTCNPKWEEIKKALL